MKKKLLLALSVFFCTGTFAQTWSSVGAGLNGDDHALGVWNGMLIAGGSFNNNPCDKIAQWNGTSWACVGSGIGTVVRAVTVFNGDLIAVGDFWNNSQPCTNCNGVARWDGTQWTPLGTGFNNDVLALTVWNGDLVAGGDFTTADGNPCTGVARWTGSQWVPIGGTNDFNNDVRALAVYNGELYVGGDFSNVGGCTPCDRITKWNGTAWVGGGTIGISGGLDSTVRALYVFNNKLYMGGHFLEVNGNTNCSGVAVYDGTSWQPLGTGVNSYVRAIHAYNSNIIVGGDFTMASATPANRVAKWDGAQWLAMGSGMNGYLRALHVYNGEIYAGGEFTEADGSPQNYIARWYEPPPPPIASFSVNNTSICEGSCVNFSDLTANSPTSWTWSFPGGTPATSNVQNPSVCYNSPGTYSVTLIVANATSGDTITMNNLITVNPLPIVTTTADTTICPGGAAQLQVSGGGSYQWIPSTGLSCTTCSNPVATPSSSTSYVVIVTSPQGCQNTGFTIVTVDNCTGPPPVASFTVNNSTICEGVCVNFSDQSTNSPTSWQWNFPGGTPATSNVQNPSVCYNSAGIFNVTLIATNGTGSDTVTVNSFITVNALPSAFAGPDDTICSGGSAQLQASGGGTCQWIPSTGLSCTTCSNPVASPTTTTTYEVIVTSLQGCQENDYVTITVQNCGSLAPVASFSVNNSSICEGDCVSFSDQSTNSPTSWQWSFTGGTPASSNAQNPSICYNSAGTYNVTLIVVNGSGSDTITMNSLITVNPLPVASAGPDDTICSGGSVQLQASGGSSYQWTPSTGLSCVTCSNPVASPATSTNYVVIVTGPQGCQSNDYVTVTVQNCSSLAPVASFSVDNSSICEGVCINFSDQTTNSPTSWEWSFPGGTPGTSNSQNPSVCYSSSGTYNVTLIAANGTGSDTITMNSFITVNPLPVASAGPDDTICAGESVQLQASGGGSYQWTPATDLSCITCSDPVASPATSTNYVVIVTSPQGCQGNDFTIITVEVCNGEEEQFIENAVTVFPNPFHYAATVEFLPEPEKDIFFVMYDFLGNEVRMVNTRESRFEIKRNGLPAGIYFYTAMSEDKMLGSGKLILE